MDSIKQIYRIGHGPSSSHTMGPKRAASIFLKSAEGKDADHFRVTLYGSLAATGRGHLTDQAIIDTLSQKGEVEIVQKAVDFITDFNAQCKKPVITPRNRFFQLPEMARQARLKLQEIRERENRELKFEGGTLVWNYEADRLQILFDSIPDDQRRKELKSYGFKWSPRYQAWQRQLTQNAVYAVKRVLNLQNL